MEIEDLIDQKMRLKEGIFFTKPIIVDEIVKNFNFSNISTVLDSAAGSCNFLIDLARKYNHINFYGVEKNETIYKEVAREIKDIPNLNYFHGDIILDSFKIPKCDLYLGNPPFINYSDLDEEYRDRIKDIWLGYFPESRGFKMLLGDSRGDISQLIFYLTINKYLKSNGQFGVILPNSLIKGNSASAGFREFKSIAVEKIVDIGDKNPFDNTNRSCFYILGRNGSETTYPIEYITKGKSVELIKAGSDLIEQGTSLLTGSPYTARQGVNTLGANSVFFFKKSVPFESSLIKPLLKSSDITPFKCTASYKILLPYQKGRLLEDNELKEKHPEVYNYLVANKNILENRKSRFTKKYWYNLFGIGDYTFKKYKVIWRGLGAKSLMAAVAIDVIPNQAMNCYISLDNIAEAYYICGVMNSDLYKEQLGKLNESGAKSFAQPSTINRIFIPKYNENNKDHHKLSKISCSLHEKLSIVKTKELNDIVKKLYKKEAI